VGTWSVENNIVFSLVRAYGARKSQGAPLRPIPIKIKLGSVNLSFVVGDLDKDGSVDITLGVRLLGYFEWTFPPFNLDAAAAENARRAFEAVSLRLAKKDPA
jgi:hypothetical protein